MTGGYLHGLPSANGWRRGGTLDDTSWLLPSRISLGATHSRGCNRRPMHAALKASPTVGKSAAGMVCPLGGHGRLTAARSLPPSVPTARNVAAVLHSRKLFQHDGTV
jgi:hypothetical protein